MSSRGFTLVELLVSVAIFAMMTALIVAKYGNFNQSVLLTNLAYDVALTIRTAQTYGLNVRNVQQGSAAFQNAYGVDFNPGTSIQCTTTSNSGPTQFVMFADTSPAPISKCDSADALVSAYILKRGAVISGVCTGTGPANCTLSNLNRLDITYKRPDPNAIICDNTVCNAVYAQIEVKATDGSKRIVEVRENGQISVLD